MGPFYCPADQTIYIDTSFYDQLDRQLGARRRLRALLRDRARIRPPHPDASPGVADQIRSAQSQNPRSANQLQVRMELQADCYAGVWAGKNRNLIEPGDFEEGMTAASAIGDDTLTGGRVSSENFTHGTSAQRTQALRPGSRAATTPCATATFRSDNAMRITIIAALAAFAVAAPALAQQGQRPTRRDARSRCRGRGDDPDHRPQSLQGRDPGDPAHRARAIPTRAQGSPSAPRSKPRSPSSTRLLGPDMDVAARDPDRLSTGKVAQSLVGSLIPFRGVLRELTGAAGHQREFQAAIYAGAVRRGFLKGLGQQKGCAYPARPAFAADGAAGRRHPRSRRARRLEPSPKPASCRSRSIQPVPGTKSAKR